MFKPISVFLCHKKLLSISREGQEDEQDNKKASILHDILNQHPEKYNAWIDDKEISAGMDWEKEIYAQMLVSDVLLIAIGSGTSESEWVRREISLARALGVSIIPLGYDLTQAEFKAELEGLQINDIQGKLVNIDFATRDALLQEIHSDLELARDRTTDQQAKVLAIMNSRRNIPIPRAEDKQKAYSLEAKLGGSKIFLHVAAGDLTKTRGIDVLVNSENDFMQMARFFETRTVSSLLRRRGAIVQGGKYVDTIQRELDTQLGERARPVQAAEVFATSAGGPDSQLAKVNKTRYIFHVAAVHAIEAEARVIPLKQAYHIEECVRACLDQLVDLNEKNGVISPTGSDQRAEQQRRAEKGEGICRSILFPVFGTGQGGSSTSEAIKPMLAGILRFFDDSENSQLANQMSDIYIAAFRQPDVDAVVQQIRSTFG